VAELDGRIVGSGVGTENGPAGWIGTIWVAPALRGAGLGRALTQAVIDDLERIGCRTLLLVATEEGQRLYERMGFMVQTHYQILEAQGLPPGGDPAAQDGVVRPFAREDLGAVVALDRAATGEDRRHLLERFATPASAKVLEVDREVRAFVVRAPWGGGATVAADAADALLIHEARRRASGPARRVHLGLLDENAAGLALFEEHGYRRRWAAPRLVRGDPLEWRPSWIWGQFNLALG
jgi:hypothetical protein